MSVVAAQAQAAAAVGLAAVAQPPAVVAVSYGLCGGGARKRKDVVQEEEAAEGEGRCDDGDDVARPRRRQHGGHGLFVLETVEEEEEEEERSSIGAVSDDDEEGEEVESKPETPPWRRKKCAFTCLDALDDALPIKRGLSNFFSGKSRSFANLQDVTGTSAAARDVLAKPENPFNKRRRILRCTSIRRVSSTSLTALPPFLPSERPRCSNNVDDAIGGAGGGSG